MKPLHLTVSAFGPYAGVVDIPFKDLGDAGIYLICGDTGAGKTTVFDAISFALFGKPSGDGRDGRSLRSDFASPGTETYVDLTFSYRGKTYRIRRSPAYERAKLRGEGTTEHAASVEFARPGQPPLTKARDADEAVVQVLGINREQFAQIVMIAQGEFRKLITSSTAERAKIFRRLFSTKVYERFQENLQAQHRAVKEDYDKTALLLRAAAANADFGGETARAHAVAEKLASGNANPRWIADELRTQADEDVRAEEESQQVIEQLEKRRDEAKATLAQADYLDQARENLRNAEEELKRAEGKLPELKRALDDASAHDAERAALASRIASLAASMGSFDRLDEVSKRCEKARQAANRAQENADRAHRDHLLAANALDEAERAERSLASADADLARAQEQENAATERLAQAERDCAAFDELEAEQRSRSCAVEQIAESTDRLAQAEKDCQTQSAARDAAASSVQRYADAPERLALCEATATASQERIDRLASLSSDLEEHLAAAQSARTALDAADAAYLHKRAQADAAAKRYRHTQQRYLDGQAGMIASALSEGAPCPVCGSTSHPHPAPAVEDVPTKANLTQAENDVNRLRGEAEAAASERASCAAAYEERRQHAEELQQKSGGAAHLAHACAEARRALLDATRKADDARRDKALLATAQEALLAADQALEAAQKKRDACREAKRSAQAALDAHELRCEMLSRGLPFASKDEAQRARVEAARALDEARQTKERCASAQDNLRAARDKHGAAKERLSLSLTAKEKSAQDLLAARAHESALSAQLEEIKQALPYPDREQAARALSDDERSLAHIDDAKSAAEAAFAAGAAARDKAQERCLTLRAHIKQYASVDRRNAMQAIAETDEALKQERERRETVVGRLRKNADALTQIQDLAAQSAALEKRYADIATLSDTASGKLTGKARISFETYVQSRYFDLVIDAANYRLSAITEGRYELSRRKASATRGHVGLDLDVLDRYTGKVRDASTLSGGESFEASLSLALGLSDVVQQHAGGVELNAMFIDEGFGSLDAEALSRAVRMLTTLSGNDKLIGVISHIDELKSSIDRKIVVKRSPEGSSLVMET